MSGKGPRLPPRYPCPGGNGAPAHQKRDAPSPPPPPPPPAPTGATPSSTTTSPAPPQPPPAPDQELPATVGGFATSSLLAALKSAAAAASSACGSEAVIFRPPYHQRLASSSSERAKWYFSEYYWLLMAVGAWLMANPWAMALPRGSRARGAVEWRALLAAAPGILESRGPAAAYTHYRAVMRNPPTGLKPIVKVIKAEIATRNLDRTSLKPTNERSRRNGPRPSDGGGGSSSSKSVGGPGSSSSSPPAKPLDEHTAWLLATHDAACAELAARRVPLILAAGLAVCTLKRREMDPETLGGRRMLEVAFVRQVGTFAMLQRAQELGLLLPAPKSAEHGGGLGEEVEEMGEGSAELAVAEAVAPAEAAGPSSGVGGAADGKAGGDGSGNGVITAAEDDWDVPPFDSDTDCEDDDMYGGEGFWRTEDLQSSDEDDE